MKTYLLPLCCILISFNLKAQDPDEKYTPNYISKTNQDLNRFFLDGVIGVFSVQDLNTQHKNATGGFLGARVGFHFALNRSKQPFFFKFLLPQINIFACNEDVGVAGFLPGLGFGKQQNLSKNWHFQGAIMANFGGYLGVSEIHSLGILVVPQLKLIYKELSFGIEGSYNQKKVGLTNYKNGFIDNKHFSGFYAGITIGYSLYKIYHSD